MPPSEFAWDNKSLGRPGTIPEICLACGERLCDKGWEKRRDEIHCRACGQTFEI